MEKSLEGLGGHYFHLGGKLEKLRKFKAIKKIGRRERGVFDGFCARFQEKWSARLRRRML